MKTAKRILTVALALMLIFAMAAPSFAYTPPADAAYYLSTTEPSLSVGDTVYVSILSNKVGSDYISYFNIDVNIPTAGVYHVSDILNLLQNDNRYDLTFYTRPDEVLTGTAQYLYAVTDDNILDLNNDPVVFGPNYPEYDRAGWMFRINDRFPLIPSTHPDWPSGYNEDAKGPIGATIDQAYVQNGNYISLYFGLAQENEQTTTDMKVVSVSNDTVNERFYFAVTESTCYYDDDYPYYWNIGAFGHPNYQSIDVVLNNTPYTAYAYGYSGNNTWYRIYNCNAASGVNILEIIPDYDTYTGTNGTYVYPLYLNKIVGFMG